MHNTFLRFILFKSQGAVGEQGPAGSAGPAGPRVS